jgi:hypothetical protein
LQANSLSGEGGVSLLTADDFSDTLWDLLRESQRSETKLERLLTAQPREVLVVFYNEFIQAAADLRHELSDLLREKTDDTQKDIVEYVVAQGKERYAEVLAHPERLPTDVDSNDVWVKGVVIGVYWDRFQERIPRIHLGESL